MSVKVIVATAIVGICAICALLLVVIGMRTAREHERIKAAFQIENDPLTIAVSNVAPDFWYLSINSAGRGELTVDLDASRRNQPWGRQREFTVPKAQFDALRQLLLAERFFELQPAYGEPVPDSGTTTITVAAGDQSKTVRIHYLGNWIRDDIRSLREPARALRVLELVYGWCDDPLAVQYRSAAQDLIELAEP